MINPPNTPRTDAIWTALLNSNVGPGIFNKNEWGHAGVMFNHARALERDRAELLKHLKWALNVIYEESGYDTKDYAKALFFIESMK